MTAALHQQPKQACDLTAELAALGREAARDAWVEARGDLERVPCDPDYRAWAALGSALCLLETEQRFTDNERRVFAHAYRNELQVLAAGGAR